MSFVVCPSPILLMETGSGHPFEGLRLSHAASEVPDPGQTQERLDAVWELLRVQGPREVMNFEGLVSQPGLRAGGEEASVASVSGFQSECENWDGCSQEKGRQGAFSVLQSQNEDPWS